MWPKISCQRRACLEHKAISMVEIFSRVFLDVIQSSYLKRSFVGGFFLRERDMREL